MDDLSAYLVAANTIYSNAVERWKADPTADKELISVTRETIEVV